MKIMYCITNSSWGGAQLQVLELCQNQINRGNEVVFVVGSKGPLFDRIKRIQGVRVIHMPSLHRELHPFYDVKVIFDLRRLIRRESPDILHLHSSKAGTVGRLAAIGLPTKKIFTVHGWAFTNGISSVGKKKVYKFVEKLVAPLTDEFICVSKFDLDLGISENVIVSKKSNAIVIKNGVPSPDEYNNFREHDKVELVMTARFSLQKDQKTLLYALKQIENLKFHMTFVGDGETYEENKMLANKLDLTEKIDFVGFKDDVVPFLKNSDIYILATHYEGLPISIIEAMSYSLPIVATDVGGNSELVFSGVNGILCENENVDQLAVALSQLIQDSDKAKQYGEKSFLMYEKDYRLKDMLNKVNETYIKLVD